MLKKNLKTTLFFLLISLGLIYYGSINKLVIFDLPIPDQNFLKNSFEEKTNSTINNSTTLKSSSLKYEDILARDSVIFSLNDFLNKETINRLSEMYFKNMENEIKKNIILNNNKIKKINSKFKNYSFKKIKGVIFYRLEMISQNPKELIELTNAIIKTSKEATIKNLNISLEEDYKNFSNKKYLAKKIDLNNSLELLNYCKTQYEKDPDTYKMVNLMVKTEKANITINLNAKYNDFNNKTDKKDDDNLADITLASSVALINRCSRIDFKNFDVMENALNNENENINKITIDAKKIKFNETIPDLASNINIFVEKLINPFHIIVISIFLWILILYFFKNKEKIFKDFI